MKNILDPRCWVPCSPTTEFEGRQARNDKPRVKRGAKYKDNPQYRLGG
jgi:hypothetical protein